MQKEDLSTTAVATKPYQESVELELKICGKREQILTLLEQMNTVSGFSVVQGSFVVSTPHKTSV